MPWWEAAWTQWLGWTLLFAVISWGVQMVQAFLGERLERGGLGDVVQIAAILIPLLAAFLIGVRLRTWWWTLGPPLAIVLLTASYPLYGYFTMPVSKRQQGGAGMVLVMLGILVSALMTLLAAVAGIWFGKTRLP